jgi:hypothetical protein
VVSLSANAWRSAPQGPDATDDAPLIVKERSALRIDVTDRKAIALDLTPA